MAWNWTRLVSGSSYSTDWLGRRVWLLSVAAAVAAISIALGVEPGSRASYAIIAAGGVVALVLPWWLGRGSDGR